MTLFRTITPGDSESKARAWPSSKSTPAARPTRPAWRDQPGPPRHLYLGDVITAVDQTKVTSYDDLYNALENYKIGDVVTLTVERDGKSRKVRITLVQSD